MAGRASETAAPAYRIGALERLARNERQGLRIAIALRTAVVVSALLWYVVAFIGYGFAPRPGAFVILLALVLVGVAHLAVIGTRIDRGWIKYVVLTMDVAAITAAYVFIPVSTAAEVPQILAIRSWGVHVLVPVIALSALTLSAAYVAYAGLASAAAWVSIFLILSSQIADPLSWDDLSRTPTLGDYERVFLSVDFIGRGTRVIEIGILLITAAILAFAVARARQMFLGQVRAEALHANERSRRERASATLSRFVPKSIAERMLRERGEVAAEEREATVMFLDIAGFSSFAEAHSPHDVIARLDAFLSECSAAVDEAGDTVLSFTGDGLLATFNTPIAHDEPRRAALAAARMIHTTRPGGFACRLGLAHGPVVAGPVGSDVRQAFTVYGRTVNIAARLEAHGKACDAWLVMDAAVAQACAEAEPLGPVALRGIDVPTEAYALRG